MSATHHAGMEEQSSTNDALAACLAVLELAGSLALFVVAWRPHLFRHRRSRRHRELGGLRTAALGSQQPPALARAGPAELQVFRL